MSIEIRPPTNDVEIAQLLALRQEIFIVEQARARDVDADEVDSHCQHFVAVEGGQVIGTLRLYLLHPGDQSVKIGRVAVRTDRRGEGIGSKLMDAAHAWAAGKYPSTYLHSQVTVIPFYDKLGYVTEGDVFLEAGTEHQVMRRTSAGKIT